VPPWDNPPIDKTPGERLGIEQETSCSVAEKMNNFLLKKNIKVEPLYYKTDETFLHIENTDL
jgi:hypothetical protein